MTVRLVVTGDVDGRSRIITDSTPPEFPFWQDLWIAGPKEPLGHAPAEEAFEVDTGAARWRVFTVPPDEVLRKMIAEHSPDALDDPKALFHKTNTLDYIYVLDGDITLELEDGETLLHPGDCVVQSNTNHAWHNTSDKPVRLLGVMIGL
jgi:mannose-6-phosphate isomerase-like protein (cupin superfamily)